MDFMEPNFETKIPSLNFIVRYWDHQNQIFNTVYKCGRWMFKS